MANIFFTNPDGTTYDPIRLMRDVHPELTPDQMTRVFVDMFNISPEVANLTNEELQAELQALEPGLLESAKTGLRSFYQDEDAPEKIMQGDEYDLRTGLIMTLHLARFAQEVYEMQLATMLEKLEEEHGPQYLITYGGNRIRPLLQINTRTTPPPIDPMSGHATIQRGALSVRVENFDQLISGWGAGVHKFLQYATMKLAEQNHHKESQVSKLRLTVCFPLDEYLEATGTPLTKSHRQYQTRKIEDFLQTLYETSINWSDPEQYRWERPLSCRIIGAKGVKRGVVAISFSPEFAHYIVNTTPYPLNQNIFKIDERKPAALNLAIRLNEYYCMDINKKIDPETGEITGGQYNYVSVKTVLEWLSDTIPSREEVYKSHRRKYTEKITQPLHAALNELEEKDVCTWEYRNSGREPLTEEQRAEVEAGNYDTIKDLYIQFDMTGKVFTDKDIQRILENRSAAIKEKERQQKMKEKAEQKALEERAKKDLEKKDKRAKV